MKDCIANRLNVVCYPVEIGAQGFVARSMVKLMKELGLGGIERLTLIIRLGVYGLCVIYPACMQN